MANRIKIPFIVDIVIVSDADEIKKVDQSEDIDRLHYYDSKDLPWWAKLFFKATRYYDFERDLWFCPFAPKSDPGYKSQLNYLKDHVLKGYDKDDVSHITHLLKSNALDEDIRYAMVQVVNRRFFGKDIPKEIIHEAQFTFQSIGEMVNPFNYKRAVLAQQNIATYCEENLDSHVNFADICHNIGTVVHTIAGALKTLKNNINQDVEKIFTQNPLTPQVPRIAINTSNIGGLLKTNAIASKTVFICKIGKAAVQTGDLTFTFGIGTSERECIFKDFFLSFMKDVQLALKSGEGA
jgi:hypothetical protein